MTTFAIGGQSSGDFRETSARVQLLHVVTRNSVGVLTPDAFTQANPPVVTTQKSTTLATITKVGVLGGSIAFTRPDFGNGFHGGPVKVGGAYVAGQKPLGIFINDSLGNAFENTPGVASGRGPYVCGSGSTVGVSIYETKQQLAAAPGDPVTYNPGDKVYASVNGLLTNVVGDTYENQVGAATPTLIGIVKVAPDANSSLLVIDLRV
jgi:hypothetical protein